MTTKEQKQALAQLGLDDREQLAYLALLDLGVASIQEIAKKARLERTSLYGVIGNLISQGLVAETRRGKRKAFVAEDPARLEAILKEKQQQLKRALPELRTLWKTKNVRPSIRYFEGREGMRSVLLETLNAKDKQLFAILSAEDIFKAVGERWFEQYTRSRIESGLSLKVVRTLEKEVGERWPTSKAENREVKYSPENLVFSMTTYIFGNKVALLSTREENFGMIIESDQFATQQRNLFESLWQISSLSQEQNDTEPGSRFDMRT